ncbi:nucleic acid/nucleotide deaminase domain-containing protein [Streptomyces sp. NPDC001339]|uniref:nucleic acid/nucleotide deaminase domain-containing protein n=1 Tax=Streptomyces sp. NPDC001339 TaxID=3364563 RepID=UPI0036B27E19
MGVVLPGWADEILDIIGVSWPNVDEDDYRDMADSLREFADDIDHGANQAHQVIQSLVGASGGSLGVEALNAHWGKINGKHLKGLAECGRLAATAMDAVAVLIEGAKIGAIAQLAILAAEVIAAQAAAPFTFGLSELGALAGTQATRLAVRRIIKEVCEQVVEQIVSVALTPVEEALGAMVGDLVVQVGANALGLQKGIDVGHAAQAGKDAGKSAATDMQLLTAGGGSGGSGGGGGGGGGGAGSGGFTFDPDAHDNVVTGLQGAGGTFRNKAGGKIGRAKDHHGRTRGKDVIANAAAPMIDKVIDGLETGIKRTAKHLDEKMVGGIKKMKLNHRENDDSIATEIQSIGKKSHGNAPTYHVDDKGKVTRLTSAGHQDLTDQDRRRLTPIGLQGDDHVGRRVAGNYPLPPVEQRKKKPSRQVPFGSTDLSQATQLARHANTGAGGKSGDYGRVTKGNFTSRNYAAARYGEPGAENEFILVGRSKWPGMHSERQVGIPFLDSGNSKGMTELYTEREPCTTGPGTRNCSAWMAEHLPAGVQVSHSVEYGDTDASRKKGNEQMENYLNGINRHKRH